MPFSDKANARRAAAQEARASSAAETAGPQPADTPERGPTPGGGVTIGAVWQLQYTTSTEAKTWTEVAEQSFSLTLARLVWQLYS